MPTKTKTSKKSVVAKSTKKVVAIAPAIPTAPMPVVTATVIPMPKKKPVPKKTVAKKPVVKASVKKPAGKKPVANKTVSKKAAPKMKMAAAALRPARKVARKKK